eukprot:Pgem_evm1s19213
MKNRLYSKVLSCYLRDEARKRHFFNCLEQLLRYENISNLERSSIKSFVSDNIAEIVVIDPQ